MLDFVIMWLILTVLFSVLFIIPRQNRNKRFLKRSMAWFAVPFVVSNAIIAMYRNMDGVLGYTFQQNRGLAGGYLCVFIALVSCVIWYLCISISNKRMRVND